MSTSIFFYSSGSKLFNSPLREGVETEETKSLQEELSKLLPYGEAPLYRGTSMETVERLLEGEELEEEAILRDPAFFSTTKSERYLVESDFLKDCMIVVLDHSTGRDITEVSAFPEEEEVLFLPGTMFEVVEIDYYGEHPADPDDTCVIIYVEEYTGPPD